MTRFKTLAPVAGFSSGLEVFSTLRLYRLSLPQLAQKATEQLRCVLQAEGVDRCEFASSGKAALYKLLCALRAKSQKPYLLIAAYTCPDVASAVLKAGFTPYLVDVEPETLRMNQESLNNEAREKAAGVLLSNLYGIPDDLEPWRKFSEDFFLIDDACQAFQTTVSGKRVGLRPGTFGVLSFGRGKSLCGCGGGAILLPHGADLTIPPSEPGIRFKASVAFIKNLLGWSFEHPLLYTLASSLPFLRLGSTFCELEFPVGDLGAGEAVLALAQCGKLDSASQIRREKAQWLQDRLRESPQVALPSLLAENRRKSDAGLTMIDVLRLPVVCRTPEMREMLLAKLESEGLGANASYPKTLEKYAEIDGKLRFGHIQGADSLSRRILTLPVHRHVTLQAQRRIIEIMDSSK